MKKIFLFVVSILVLSTVSVSGNLELPIIYDETKLEIKDWKYIKTSVDLDKDSKLDVLLTYYKVEGEKVIVEYVPYLNNGSDKYLKVLNSTKEFDKSKFTTEYKPYTEKYINEFEKVQNELGTVTNKVPEVTSPKQPEKPVIPTKIEQKPDQITNITKGKYPYIEKYDVKRPKNVTFDYKYTKNGPTNMDEYIFISNATAKIRTEPSTKSNIIREVQYTNKFKVVGKVKNIDATSKLNWYEIIVDGKTGYVADNLAIKRSFDFNDMAHRIDKINKFIDNTVSKGEKLYVLDDYAALASTPNNIKDKFGNRESQSERAYTTTDFKEFIFLPDRTLVRILEETDKYVKIEANAYGTYYLKKATKKLLKDSGVNAKINKFIYVDRSSQNEIVVEKNTNSDTWNVLTTSYVTTGKDGGSAVITPYGDFLIAFSKPSMQYTSDSDTSKIVGDAPNAVRFSGGAYLHGIPSSYEPAANRSAREAATARKIGTYPESHKCVRHYDDQIKFIYDWLGNSTPGSKLGTRVPLEPTMVLVK